MSKIDFVIYWVNGSDPDWQKEYCKFKGREYEKEAFRFRDWDNLKYWFRAAEKYAPWVNQIFLVTNGQCPEWLNLNNPKIRLIKHQDYIPSQYLPTFNSHTVELFLHKIPGISEQFVIFNDDMFINSPITPEYYFKDGLPCDATLESACGGKGYTEEDKWGISIIDYCNTQIINANFNRRKVTKNNFGRWYGPYLGLKYQIQAILIGLARRENFCHFSTPHNEKAMLKSVYEEAWEKVPDLLSDSCTTFRENTNLSCYFIRYWQLASNRFYPKSPKGKHCVAITEESMNEILSLIKDDSIKSLCLNDTMKCDDKFYKYAKDLIKSAFEEKFSQKSTYEQ